MPVKKWVKNYLGRREIDVSFALRVGGTMDLRAFIKNNIPGVSLGANLFRGVHYLKRAFILRVKLKETDQYLPFRGKLSETGYAELSISKKSVTKLISLKAASKLDAKNPYGKVCLTADTKTTLTEIFDLIGAEVRAYLGSKAYLDGINWMVSAAGNKSISGNWHTDNVGSRLKLFVCVEGDGSQPTFLVPSDDRIPRFACWLKQTLLESFRWFGMENKKSHAREVALKHKKGTVFLFDTQLLHRGGYGKGAADRVIFHMEFSNPDKHAIVRGPIGSKSFNSFQFDESLLDVKSFKNILDPARVTKSNGVCHYGI